MAIFHSDVDFVTLMALDCPCSGSSPSAPCHSVLQENPEELDRPCFSTRTDTPGIFQVDFVFLYFPNLIGKGTPCRAAWFCVGLKSAEVSPHEAEPFNPLLQITASYLVQSEVCSPLPQRSSVHCRHP